MSPLPRPSSRAYSLVELLVAAAILLLAIAAAASLAITLSTQEDLSTRAAIALNYQEQSARLWQLGFGQDEILGADGLLPPIGWVDSLTIVEADIEILPSINIREAECAMVFRVGLQSGVETSTTRTNTIRVVRSDP